LPDSALEEAFRRAHSLKGAARAVELTAVEGLAHRLETLFARVRQGALQLDSRVAGVISRALDASEDCVAGLNENRPAQGIGPSQRAIEQLLGIEPDANAPKTEPSSAPVPSFETPETMRVGARNFDGVLRSAGGLLAESLRQDEVRDRLRRIAAQLAALEKETASMHRAAAAALRRAGPDSALVRATAFLRSMEKQVHALGREAEATRRFQQHNAWAMQRLGRQLQRDVWQARMVPAEELLDGMRKIVRDLARDESKEVELRFTCSSGAYVDRRVIEALKDPLMHVLRNTVSHGIRTPQERSAAGKPTAGLVTLRIETEGQRLTILVEDDGAGVDLARVEEVAVRQGILSEAEAAASAQQLYRVLFRPGFSTSRVVTNLAGRGMGLSVVYETVHRLQGDVEIGAAEGGGMQIRISVPLSIASHRLLVAAAGTDRFAIPIRAIERLYRIRPENIELIEGRPAIVLDKQPVPLVSLHHLVGTEAAPGGRAEALQVMVLRAAGKRAAVSVDSFLQEMDAIVLDPGPAAPRDGKVSGGILLDDGSIAFVLDVRKLLETPVPRELQPIPLPAPEREKQRASILVVDDSLTTRTLEKSILEAYGYRVRIAVDGLDAIEKLRAEKADLVISDVQMPRLDGFGLLEVLKRDPAFGSIPVILVTSLDRPEDQARGLSSGAGAYIVKRKFDQAELLSAVRQVL
ncbi:MAG TPA: response regulator, partial [Bryobacteraceae bacterium]|nr:response regulator [Bryobacteraceae bacterium]